MERFFEKITRALVENGNIREEEEEGTLVDHQNLFPSVSRFSREHCSVQTGTDDQIIVFHSFYMFPFSQTHLDTFLY